MMGKQAPQEAKLFYYDICLERRIPQNHLLRKIKNILDFDFVYPIVKGKPGTAFVIDYFRLSIYDLEKLRNTTNSRIVHRNR